MTNLTKSVLRKLFVLKSFRVAIHFYRLNLYDQFSSASLLFFFSQRHWFLMEQHKTIIYFFSPFDLNSRLHNKTVTSLHFVNLFLRRPYTLGSTLHQLATSVFMSIQGNFAFRFHSAENFFFPRTCAIENCAHDQSINTSVDLLSVLYASMQKKKLHILFWYKVCRFVAYYQQNNILIKIFVNLCGFLVVTS